MKKASKKSIPKTLILGATPELRDLVHGLGHQVVLVDVSIDMVNAMRTLMKNQTSKEIVVVDDWLSAPLQESYFDYILGDFVVVNLPFKLQEQFLNKIHKLLKPGGMFIHRHWTVPRLRTSNEVVSYYSNENLNHKQTRNEFADALNKTSFDPKNYTVSLKRSRALVANKKYLRIYKSMYNGNKVWWATPAKVLEKMQNKYFRLVKIGRATDHAEALEDPIYVLSNK